MPTSCVTLKAGHSEPARQTSSAKNSELGSKRSGPRLPHGPARPSRVMDRQDRAGRTLDKRLLLAPLALRIARPRHAQAPPHARGSGT